MEKKLNLLPTREVSPERSRNMAKIKSYGNKSTEVRLRMLLVREGIKGWEMQRKDLPGKPDFYFPLSNVILFVDGCFWHGCPRCNLNSKTNKDFWITKINGNKKRDRKYNRYYRTNGFIVIRIWEHDLKSNSPIISKKVLILSKLSA
jgi:DNA mismatch endonuclease (patch repair protein)